MKKNPEDRPAVVDNLVVEANTGTGRSDAPSSPLIDLMNDAAAAPDISLNGRSDDPALGMDKEMMVRLKLGRQHSDASPSSRSADSVSSRRSSDELHQQLHRVVHHMHLLQQSSGAMRLRGDHKDVVKQIDALDKAFSEMRGSTVRQIEDTKEENQRLKAEFHELQERIAKLEKINKFQATEIESGKAMIEQFSSLMRAKADQVCQYCRRSGTLPPMPNG
ncbi:unnamed protein product [Vitrella brassicaformis CCMP3155]|uniref:Uncharacterized protein n=2 Tax=Vitrella brassicaformis TaxID=1169539 RepID=A0A0G4E8K6_VITBC|nr:unnamed protein product [Vitrella brassicaformis CCMP3155]|mmetsp:Transcript_5881/g.16702  ORF Transcript_5881/g.16702 Transcript_5881/m.16702 type:complete len:220 (+) Transcript_5881:695-1354(+)|eukprot:CEL91682.1 unnamed protein product [Vitrella brassicaformis CCMP3155]